MVGHADRLCRVRLRVVGLPPSVFRQSLNFIRRPAVAIKRLHDRDKSAWWMLPFALVPLILLKIAFYTGAAEVRLIFGLVPGPSCYDYYRHGSEGTLVP
jgi:hypothetical protein